MKIFIFLLILYSGFVDAGIYKCVSDDGKVVYTDRECDTETRRSKDSNGQPKQGASLLSKGKSSHKSTLNAIGDGFSQYRYQIVFLAYFLMSGICYNAYRKDKHYAQTQQWRIPEATLHLYALLGGWPGGLIAQRILRHKNKKLLFQFNFWLIASLHVIGWFDYIFLNKHLLSQVTLFISSLI